MRITFSAVVGQAIDFVADISKHKFWKENALKVCEDEENISGRIVIVTGSNTGIGKQVALQMAKRGAVVIMAVRNLDKGREALAYIKRQLQGQVATIELMELDLADLDSIRNFVSIFQSTYSHLDILINNAGIMDLSYTPSYTKENFELHIGVNHLGPFLLARLLLPALHRSPQAHSRVVCVQSSNVVVCPKNFMKDLMLTHKKRNTGNFGNEQYTISKLCNSISMMKLAKDMTSDKAKFYQLCPGLVETDIFRYLTNPLRQVAARMLLRAVGVTSHEGAETVVYCAVAKPISEKGHGEIYRFTKEWTKGTKTCGKYLAPEKIEIANKLYKWSEELVGLTP